MDDLATLGIMRSEDGCHGGYSRPIGSLLLVIGGKVAEESTEIRGNTILPARREEIEFDTEDGLILVGELALPAARTPVATLVTLHPLPTHGGFMDSHIYRKASWRLPALADLAVQIGRAHV